MHSRSEGIHVMTIILLHGYLLYIKYYNKDSMYTTLPPCITDMFKAY